MKAAYYDRYGGPEVLEIRNLPEPELRPTDLKIRVHAATTGPADMAFIRADLFIVRLMAGLFKPRIKIPGNCFSGTVIATGTKVTRYQPGDEIFGGTIMENGAFTEILRVPEGGVIAKKPASVSHQDAAGITDAFSTALIFLREEARLRPGEKILIHGASGYVGLMGVQIAVMLGAMVTGVTSTKNLGLVRSLGAHEVNDYTATDFTKRASEWDVIFDAVGKSSY